MAFKAMVKQYMGEDSRHLLMQEAGNIVQGPSYDRKSRNHILDNLCGSYRRALLDLGPEDQMSNTMEAVKFMDVFQVPEL